jgi:hypothetical protein
MAKTLDLKLENIRCGPLPEKNTTQDVKLRRVMPGDLRADASKRRDESGERKGK